MSVGECAGLIPAQRTRILGCSESCVVYGPNPEIQQDVCLFHENIEPWQHLLGATRVWLDSAAAINAIDPTKNYFPRFHELAHCPLYRNANAGANDPHFLGMESFPTTGTGGTQIDLTRAEKAPAMGFTDFIESRDSSKNWNYASSKHNTELVAVLDYSYLNGWIFKDSNGVDRGVFQILDWARRGFVLYVANPHMTGASTLIEYMKRVYDMGILSARLDFNGKDGVTAQDLTDFNAQWNAFNGKTGCNWIHGDVDGDNDVDQADKNKFMLWWNAPRPPGQQFPSPVPINLGDAEPMDVFTM